MNPLSVIYWTRCLLGIVAALLSTLLTNFAREFTFLNGMSVALLLYIVSYYIYKSMFAGKVEKPTKIFTTGIGIYFISWIVMWVLFYTLLNPTLPV
jgi:uncharacterized membrane protein YGL010W